VTNSVPGTCLQIRSLVKGSGELELSLIELSTPAPGPDEVLVRVEATPLNPSDLGLLFGLADMTTARQSGTVDRPVVTTGLPEGTLRAMAGRIDQSLPVGNEGAGTVVAAGDSPAAQALVGRTVATFGGAMYSQYRCVKAAQCLPLPADCTATDGASCFVNPLTALGMVETMRREGHSALVHTAAASNLGQMLNRLCQRDGIGLVNVVRSVSQEQILRDQGARHVCNSGAATFMQDLTAAVAETGATLAFDAVGGGPLAGQILYCMEVASNRDAAEYSRYGSATHKQVYIYGALDLGPTLLRRNFGFAWGVGGWLLMPFLQRAGGETTRKLRERVVSELKTTFASHYTRVISLADALRLPEIAAYSRRATGEKVLIDPSR
jgi:NADPH2:quinone reductase